MTAADARASVVVGVSDNHRRARSCTITVTVATLLGSFAVLSCASSPPTQPVVALEYTFAAHHGPARRLAFSPDSTLVATSGVDATVKLWRVADHQLVRAFTHPAGVTAVAFAPDGRTLASSSYDGRAYLWRTDDGERIGVLSGHTATVWSIAFSPDGGAIATSGEDKTVRIWRAGDRSLVRTLAGHTLNVWSVAFSPDGRLVASSSFDRTVRLWRADTGDLVRTLAGHSQAIVGFAFSPDGAQLASGSDDSSIRIWRVADGTLLKMIDAGNHVYAVAASEDGRWLAGGGRELGAVGTAWKQIFDHRLIARGPTVRIWSVADSALRQELADHDDDVFSAAFSPDSRWLATASNDGAVKLWRTR